MDLSNGTALSAGYTLGLDVDGRQRLVVVAKGVFLIPAQGQRPELVSTQVPLIEADVFTGEPGTSSVIYEVDFAPVKPRCDVVVNGTVYAPHERPATQVPVSVTVSEMSKAFMCHGERAWVRGIAGFTPSAPQPFVSMPITYERAYGGVDVDPDEQRNVKSYLANPIGAGYYPYARRRGLAGRPLPTTAERGRPVESTTEDYRPMAFGVIGRNFGERTRHAGTYDDQWLKDAFPFLPSDFDLRYYQCAPSDQQIDFPAGGERVELLNLTRSGYTAFELPQMDVPVEYTDRKGGNHTVQAVIDTIVIEPDLRRFSLTWRASWPLRRDVFEIVQVVVGRMPSGWYRARSLGKSYYRSLAAIGDKKDD